MRIGILTQPLRANYGGILQNWALQQTLSRLGHSPVTISYGDYPRRVRISLYVKWLMHQALRTKERHGVVTAKWWKMPCKRMHTFCDKNIVTTSGLPCCAERNWHRDRFEAYVVGSDQVWRPEYNAGVGQLQAMFGEYVPEGKKLIAYAASFGTDKWELSREMTEMARRNVSRFAAISVRERGGVALCRQHLDVDSKLVLDPTLLMKKNDYESLISEGECDKIPSRSVGVYILDSNPHKEDIVKTVASELGLSVFTMGKPDEHGIKPSVESWLAAFKRCEYIVTDSFHGTVFSIVFNTPFTTIFNPQRGNDRVESLLSSLNLRDRLEVSQAKKMIDWNSVNSALDNLRAGSIEFLRDNL